MELLPEPKHAGRMYVQGFFVAQDDRLPLYGLNYCGSMQRLLSLGFGRDRNSMRASNLVNLTPEVQAAAAAMLPRQHAPAPSSPDPRQSA